MYLKGRFWIDLLATIPFDNFAEIIFGSGNASLLSIFSLMKLVRVLRLSRIISLMKVANEVKLSLKLGKLVFFLVMYLHCAGCAWYYIVIVDKEWIPPLDYVFVTTDFYEEQLDFRYFSSIYHSVLMLTGNDIGPRGVGQYIFVISALTAGAIINANIFGELAVILASLNRKATAFQGKLDTANGAMKHLGLDEKLQVQITGFLTYSKSLLESQEELEEFMSMISPSLRHRVLKHIFSDALITNPVFNNKIEMIEFMSKRFVTQIMLPEQTIITQGEKGDDLYCIAKGECSVHVTDQRGVTCIANNLQPGDVFGEIALLCGCLRTATVKTYIYSTIAKLNKYHFDTVCSVYTWFQEKLKQRLKTYKDNMRKYQMKLITSVDYMSKLKENTLEEISYHLIQAHFEQNKVIFRAGDPVECIFFVVHGVVNISINIGDREIIIDSIGQGASIGCNGVLGNYNHNFTARASSKVTMYYISKDSLRTCMNICPDLDANFCNAQEFYEINDMPWVDFRISRLQDKPVPNKFIMKMSIVRLLRIKRGLTKKISAEEILEILKDLQMKYNRGNYRNKKISSHDVTMEMIRRLTKKIEKLEEKIDAQDRRQRYAAENKRRDTINFLDKSHSKMIDGLAKDLHSPDTGDIKVFNLDSHRKDNKDKFKDDSDLDKSINKMISYFEMDKVNEKSEENQKDEEEE